MILIPLSTKTKGVFPSEVIPAHVITDADKWLRETTFSSEFFLLNRAFKTDSNLYLLVLIDDRFGVMTPNGKHFFVGKNNGPMISIFDEA